MSDSEAPFSAAGSSGFSAGAATIIRATGLVHLGLMASLLLAPRWTLAALALPWTEPATFLRFFAVAYGTLGLGLLRAAGLPKSRGLLLVETTALVKLGFVAVVTADIVARKLPSGSAVALALDVIFGAALYRTARRNRESP
ncbi:MAG: hypothetical protein IPJ34_29140 [Myxococcales bacterium]|nr:hypothetical protein [Myxococcales bacterium]